MSEYTTPSNFVLLPDMNAADDVFINAERYPDHVAFSRKVNGAWLPVTSSQFADEVTCLTAGLLAAGISKGDRVGLMSGTSYEWTLCDYAIWSAGAVTVTLYDTSSPEQVQWYLGDSGATAIFVQTAEHEAIVAALSDRLPALKTVWRMDPKALQALADTGEHLPRDQVELARRAVMTDDLATIVYTSGTTGRPKGCALTHGNLISEVMSAARGEGVLEKLFNERKSTLLFLPLAHVFARAIQMEAVHNRARLGHSSDIKNLPAEIQAFGPTAIAAVPRIFEKIYNGARHQAALSGKARIFDMAEDTAVRFSHARDTGGPGLALRAKHLVFDRLVYRKVRATLGPNIEFAVSGGAPLGERLAHFFRGAGVSLLEGYGLTETTAGATLNLPDIQKLGTVGRPMPGSTARIAPDGEVLLKGPQIFHGYWNDEPATKEMLDEEGWLHSGDLGELDADGFLRITGRKKDLIVTAGGKNVAPAPLEETLRANWLVGECMVVGDGKPFISVLITLDPDALTLWKKETGRPADETVADLRDDPDLLKILQGAIDQVNSAVSHAESIKRFRVLASDFTEATGELTATLKVKRAVVLKRFADDITHLYGS